MINVILNVEVLTSEIAPNNLVHNFLIHFEPKDIDYNINVFKYVIKDVSEDGNDDVKQNIPDNMFDMLETESLT